MDRDLYRVWFSKTLPLSDDALTCEAQREWLRGVFECDVRTSVFYDVRSGDRKGLDRGGEQLTSLGIDISRIDRTSWPGFASSIHAIPDEDGRTTEWFLWIGSDGDAQPAVLDNITAIFQAFFARWGKPGERLVLPYAVTSVGFVDNAYGGGVLVVGAGVAHRHTTDNLLRLYE